MHLNANTSTQSFRELVFDLNAFLTAMGQLRPVEGEPDDWNVTIEWADGSVDIVPVFLLIQMLTEYYDGDNDEWSHLYGNLDIGGVKVTPSTMDTGSVYHSNILSVFVEGGPLSAKIHLVIDADENAVTRISDSHIRQLEADSVSLPPDAKIVDLDTSDVTTDSSSVKAVRITNKMTARSGIFVDLDVHSVRVGSAFKYPTVRIDASNIVDMASVSGPSKPNGFKLTGTMRLAAKQTEPLQSTVTKNRTTVSVDVPVRITGGYRYFTSNPTPVPQDISAPLDTNSSAAVVMLYPFVQIIGYSEMKDVRIHLDIPESKYDGRVVQVYNATGSDIRVCNAWMFSANGNVGVVQTLNYITFPAYTTIDFLVRLDNGGSGLRVYMLPMTSIA